ncbi:MAG TPA: HD domain-containing protein [Gemmataceae bacterium]|nr:HD domain-containing protein [Gemmataceae bacterium]
MSRDKPPILHLCEMTAGQAGDFFVLLAERTKGQTRDGKPYYQCKFRDAKRTVTMMVWLDGGRYEECDTKWRAGEFYKIRGTYHESERYGPQLEVHQMRLVQESDREEGFNPTDLVDRSRFDSDAMLSDLRIVASKHIADEPLRRLVLTILDRHGEALKRLPATRDKFYPFAGGLLEHIMSVTSICINLVEFYASRYTELQPPLNRDLVVAGAILHDIGRVLELGDEPINPQPTVPGRLIGHLILGRDVVRDMAKELGDIHPEMVQLLEHVILTHLGLPEWGSPRLPLVPEVLIVHHADDLDAKMEMYARCLSRDKETGPFTARDPALGKQLLKGRSV